MNDAAARGPAEFRLDAGSVGLRAGEQNVRLRRARFDVACRRRIDGLLLDLGLERFRIGDGGTRSLLGRGRRSARGGLLRFRRLACLSFSFSFAFSLAAFDGEASATSSACFLEDFGGSALATVWPSA